MRKYLVLVASLGLAGLAAGCAAVAALPISSVVGSPNSASLEIHNTTVLRIDEANFIVKKVNVIGQSKGFALLGLLTIVPAEYSVAAQRLERKALIEPGRPQALANLVVEKNSTYYILFSIPKVSVSADVIEFVPPITNSPARLSPSEDGESELE